MTMSCCCSSTHMRCDACIRSDQVLLDIYVRPEQPVVSYLTPLTGLTAEVVQSQGVPLAQALAALRAVLPRNAVLVGQNILQDVTWLGLREGVDYASVMDLSGDCTLPASPPPITAFIAL